MNRTIIQTEQLTKRFGEKIAVDGLDLRVEAGSILGFLGANGAGKTTTIRMLMGHLHPTGGTVEVLGSDPWQQNQSQRQKTAYVSENMDIPGYLTPAAAIKLNRRFYPDWDQALAEKLLEEFELRSVGAYRSLSKGQKRKTCILLALCQNAELLIMDEPASGLDVTARRTFIRQVLEIACNEGTAVFLSSHLLSDLERTVDRVTLLDEGRLILNGHLEDFKVGIRKIHFDVPVSLEQIAEQFKVIRYKKASEVETVVTVLDYDEQRFDAFAAEHSGTENARCYPMNLEDMFVELTRKSEAKVQLP